MKKHKNFFILTLFLAGTFATVWAIVVTDVNKSSNRSASPLSQQLTSQPDKKRIPGPSDQAETSSGRKHRYENIARTDQTGMQTGNFPTVDFLLPSFDPNKLYEALTSFNPEEAYQAIETVSQNAEALYKFDPVYRLIMELCTDDTPFVREGAQYAIIRMMSLRAAHELPEPWQFEENEERWNDTGLTWSQNILGTTVEPLDILQEQALFDPDPAVRLGGIERAISQEDETSVAVLREAALYDDEPDNRLAAVSELEQMLRTGLGHREQVLQFLEETAADPDPRVADLSELIIREQFGGSEKLPRFDENEELNDFTDKTQLQDDVEISSEPIESIQEGALVDPDPAVRLGNIEAASNQKDGAGFKFLGEAAIHDYEPDNRLSAVSSLEQMLKTGMGDRDQVLQLLEETAADPDPRVAELSELILQEQQDH